MAHPEQSQAKKSDPDTPQARDLFARRVVTAVCIGIGIIAVALFLWYSVQVLMLAFAAILIGAALRGMANWVSEKTRVPPNGALVVVILGLIGFFVVLGVLLAPRIVAQFERLADQLPQSVQSAQERLRQYDWGRKILGEGEPQPAQAQQAPAGNASGQPPAAAEPEQPQPGETVVAKALQATTRPATVGNVARYARRFFEAIFTLILVIIVGIYLAAQPSFYVEGTLMLFPKSERPRLREVMHTVGHTLQLWLRAQLIPMVAIGLFVGAGLWLLGIEMWLPLAILTALLNFIPNFGPIIAAVPQVFIALSMDPTKALWVLVLNFAAQNLEGYLITPLVQRKAVRMPPALTILSQVLMGLLLGPLGVILAAPLTAAAIVVIKMLYVEDALSTPVQTPGDSP